MPEGPDGKTIIIVKKVSGHGGGHGGAWKVAYADFITAMMALFLVLWLVNSASEPTKQRIASYFRKPGVFQKGSGTPLEIGGGGILPDTFAPPAEANSQIITSKKIYKVDAQSGKVKEYFDPSTGKKGDIGTGEEKPAPESRIPGDEPGLGGAGGEGAGGEGAGGEGTGERGERGEGEGLGERGEDGLGTGAEKEINLERLKSDLDEAIKEGQSGGGKQAGVLGEVDIKVDQRGLMIEIMDTEKASMFQVGQANILPEAEAQLLKIASVLKEIPNPIDIEGHTDGRPYRGKNSSNYDNWDLSIDRANSARRALQKVGLTPDKIARVVGYADRRPKNTNDLLDPSNRRITISMRFTEQAKAQLEGTQLIETQPQPLLRPEKREEAAKVVREAQAAAKQVEPEKDEEKKKQAEKDTKDLRIEIGTTIPEGAIIKQADEPTVRPTQIEKDKIFGPGNGFFSR